MKRAIYIFFCLIICTVNAFSLERSEQFSSHTWSTVDGLPSNSIFAMMQDKNGYIWIGTTNGLARFDGYSFLRIGKTLTTGKNGTSEHIGNIYGDRSNGLMWVTSASSNLTCYDMKSVHAIDYTACGDENRIFRVFRQQSDGMWMSSSEFGLRHIACKDGKFYKYDYTVKNHSLPTNNIQEINEDVNHSTWVATTKGLFRIDSNHKVHTVLKNTNIISVRTWKNTVFALTDGNRVLTYSLQGRLMHNDQLPISLGHIDNLRNSMVWQGKLLLFTSNATFVYDSQTHAFSKPADLQIDKPTVQNAILGYQFVADRSGRLWIFPDKGAMKVLYLVADAKFPPAKGHIYFPAMDSKGVMWIGTYCGGLYSYDTHSGEVKSFSSYVEKPLISDNYVLCTMVDRDDNIWVGTEYGGISCIYRKGNDWGQYIPLNPEVKNAWENTIVSVNKDKNGQCLISTRGDDVYTFDGKGNKVDHYKSQKLSISSICVDHNGKEWIGTRGDGLYVDDVHYSSESSQQPFLSNDIYDIVCDKQGRVWIATWRNGLVVCRNTKAKTLRFEDFQLGDNNANRISDLELADDGELWIATYGGLYQLNTNAKTITAKSIKKSSVGGSMPDSKAVICVKKTREGFLWLGRRDKVLRCKLDKANNIIKVDALEHASGIAGNIVVSLEEDKFGYLWAATDNGLARIEQKSMMVDNLQVSDRPLENNFISNSSVSLPDGRLVFGAVNGIVVVTPYNNKLYDDKSVKLDITNIEVNGVSIFDSNDDEKKILDIFSDKSITLRNDEKSLDIYFSNFDFKNIKEATYQYYLEGVDHTWRMPTTSNRASYNGLAPGHYVFHLRTRTSNGWSQEKLLKVHVRQPFYNTWIAWTLYLLLFAALVGYVYHNWNVRFKLRQKMYVEKELTDFRINFFTHIAHEFRTPLSIIVGAVRKLEEQTKNTGASPSALKTLKRGALRLNRLVNELIKFRKVSTNNMRLHVEEGDIVEFVKNIVYDFWDMTQQKGQQLVFTPFAKSFKMVFDSEVVEHVVYNLVSNAVKYTPEKGLITIKLVKEADDKVIITVEDNGPGIAAEQSSHLFEPFMHGYASQGGMGIGLYMAKRMAEIHHGALDYQSLQPHGSRFTFSLPAADEYSNEEHEKRKKEQSLISADSKEKVDLVKEIAPKAMNDCTVLIIEDDPDMLEQIKGELGEYFHVEGFMSGATGFEAVQKMKPSLVICDVMLPDMNGYEVVQKIKKSQDTKDIPVIMLTALDDEQHQMRGYKAGADDYQTKPCNYNLLIIRAAQLIKWSKKRETTVENSEPEEAIVTNKADKRFLDKLDVVIEQNIGEQDFNVDKMAERFSMGRTKFYGKVKDLTGISPNKYLLNKRMKMAAELLEEGEMNVSEICYRVGFANTSYFSNKFKEYFGVLPSKYGKK